jgi:hypothetical protein
VSRGQTIAPEAPAALAAGGSPRTLPFGRSEGLGSMPKIAQIGSLAAVAALAVFFSAPAISRAAAETRSVLLCRGLLSFGDALARAVSMRLDLERHEIATADCRKYAHLARFCTGTVISFADHHFVFNGAASPENAEFWADLRRPSRLLTVEADGTATETMRVLFLGRCLTAPTRNIGAGKVR